MGQRANEQALATTGANAADGPETRGFAPDRRRHPGLPGGRAIGPHVHAGAPLSRERLYVCGLIHKPAQTRAPVPGYPAGVQLPDEGGYADSDMGVLSEPADGSLCDELSERVSVSRFGDIGKETESLRMEGGPDWGGGARKTGQ